MPYVTSIERVALDRGKKEGKKEGVVQLLLHQMSLKFGPIPEDKQRLIESADSQKLMQWSERILNAQRLDEIWQ